jgi:hypothetical protein
MYSKWTDHLQDPKAKSDFERDIWSSRLVLDRVVQVIDEKDKELRVTTESESMFDKPNWEFRRAYKDGYAAALRNIKAFVDLDKQTRK